MVIFRFCIAEGKLTVFVRDCGSGFDLERIEDPLSPESLMKPCGRGIFLMRALMDEVEYKIDENCGTEVRLVKYKNALQRHHSSHVLRSMSLTNMLVNLTVPRVTCRHGVIRSDISRRKQVSMS